MKVSQILLTSTFVSFVTLSAWADNDELMNIAGKSISKTEFEYVYNKNLRQQTEKTSIEEYLGLFCNYKLKVAEAESMGLDTTDTFKKEYKGYRDQLVKPYMVDRNAEEQLAFEAYNRLLEEVEASHILFTITPNATAAEKNAVYQKAISVRNEALNGADFSALARKYSDDPSARSNGGYLGYFGAFYMVYPFEKAAYETKMGEISMPVETRFGYHIIKVTGRRKTRAIEVAHIMLKIDQNAPENEQAKAQNKINDIYSQLKKGADFATLAQKYSEDEGSASQGGKMPWLAAGQIVKSFEDVAFALQKGEMSQPVRTEFGWHIIKLLDEKTPSSYDMMKDLIVRRMARDERANAGRDTFMNKLKSDNGFAWNEKNIEELENLVQDSLFIAKISDNNADLFVFAGKTYPISGLMTYISNYEQISLLILRDAMNSYVDDTLTDFYVAELSSTNNEFKYLLQEYRDGMLLFEVSNKTVWNNASTDEKGLRKFFKKNKKKYVWETPHFKGFVITADNDTILEDAKAILSKKTSLPSDSLIAHIYNVYNDSVKHIRIEKGIYKEGQNKIVDYKVFGIENTDTLHTKFSNKDVCGKLLQTPEEYIDVKGPVIADYQNHLEQQWLKKLHKKYPVKVNKEVLSTIKIDN